MATTAKAPLTAAQIAAQIEELNAELARLEAARVSIEEGIAGQWSDRQARDRAIAELAQLTNEREALAGALGPLTAAHAAAEQREIEAQRQALDQEHDRRLEELKGLTAERDRLRAALHEAERAVARADARVRDINHSRQVLARRRE